MAIDSLGGFSTMNRLSSQMDRKPAETDVSRVNNSHVAPMAVSSTNGMVVDNKMDEDSKKETTKEASENHLKSALSVANSKISQTNTRCEFEYHEKTKRVSIKVIDKTTDKVVREIPPEETLEMVEKIWELAGLFVDEKR